jgi:hypothetical protein
MIATLSTTILQSRRPTLVLFRMIDGSLRRVARSLGRRGFAVLNQLRRRVVIVLIAAGLAVVASLGIGAASSGASGTSHVTAIDYLCC